MNIVKELIRKIQEKPETKIVKPELVINEQTTTPEAMILQAVNKGVSIERIT